MVNLTVRNIPDTILQHIRFYAIGSRRSVNSELLILLEEGLAARVRESVTEHRAAFPPASREMLWKELCGSWKEKEEISERIKAVYRIRGGQRNEEESR